MEWVHAEDLALEHILNHRRHGLGAEGGAIAFADASNARIGGEFHKGEIAPAPAWGWIADDKDFEISDFHMGTIAEILIFANGQTTLIFFTSA
jgi:hypothetical protein